MDLSHFDRNRYPAIHAYENDMNNPYRNPKPQTFAEHSANPYIYPQRPTFNNSSNDHLQTPALPYQPSHSYPGTSTAPRAQQVSYGGVQHGTALRSASIPTYAGQPGLLPTRPAPAQTFHVQGSSAVVPATRAMSTTSQNWRYGTMASETSFTRGILPMNPTISNSPSPYSSPMPIRGLIPLVSNGLNSPSTYSSPMPIRGLIPLVPNGLNSSSTHSSPMSVKGIIPIIPSGSNSSSTFSSPMSVKGIIPIIPGVSNSPSPFNASMTLQTLSTEQNFPPPIPSPAKDSITALHSSLAIKVALKILRIPSEEQHHVRIDPRYSSMINGLNKTVLIDKTEPNKDGQYVVVGKTKIDVVDIQTMKFANILLNRILADQNPIKIPVPILKFSPQEPHPVTDEYRQRHFNYFHSHYEYDRWALYANTVAVASVIVSRKSIEDKSSILNRSMAAYAGFRLEDINEIERFLLEILDYRVNPDLEKDEVW